MKFKSALSVVALLAAIGGCFFVFTSLFTSVSVAVERCKRVSDFKSFSETKECRHWSGDGWLDRPYYYAARGSSSLCAVFSALPKDHKGGKVFARSEECNPEDVTHWTEEPCAEYKMPSGYRCFTCTPYPFRNLLAFGPNCPDSAAYHARGLKLQYVARKSALTFDR